MATPSRTRLKTLTVVGASLLVGALVAALQTAGAKGPSLDETPPHSRRSSAAHVPDPEGSGIRSVASSKTERGTPAQYEDSERLARVRSDGFQPTDLYATVHMTPDGTFEEEMPSPTLGPACARYAGPVRAGLRSHIYALGFAPRYVTPSDVHVVDWNRHLRLGKAFLQVSVVWNQDIPSTYAVLARSGDSPEILDTALPTNEGGPTPVGALDVVEALALAERIVARLEAQGAIPGARTMVLTDRVFDPGRVSRDAPRRAEFRNGALVSYQDAAIGCGEAAEGFLCDCPLP